jgi:hypothetical protein
MRRQLQQASCSSSCWTFVTSWRQQQESRARSSSSRRQRLAMQMHTWLLHKQLCRQQPLR